MIIFILPVGRGDDLLGAGGQLVPGLLGVGVVSNDGGVVARASGETAAITRLLFEVGHQCQAKARHFQPKVQARVRVAKTRCKCYGRHPGDYQWSFRPRK